MKELYLEAKDNSFNYIPPLIFWDAHLKSVKQTGLVSILSLDWTVCRHLRLCQLMPLSIRSIAPRTLKNVIRLLRQCREPVYRVTRPKPDSLFGVYIGATTCFEVKAIFFNSAPNSRWNWRLTQSWRSSRRQKGGESVVAIWRVPQRHAICLGWRKLASCSLVRREIVNETGVQCWGCMPLRRPQSKSAWYWKPIDRF